jgi:hypothetical protein
MQKRYLPAALSTHQQLQHTFKHISRMKFFLSKPESPLMAEGMKILHVQNMSKES